MLTSFFITSKTVKELFTELKIFVLTLFYAFKTNAFFVLLENLLEHFVVFSDDNLVVIIF